DDAHADISYALHQGYWGRGLMGQAAERIARYGFDTLKLNRLSAAVFPDNLASLRILEKLGMIREGCLRQYRSTRGAREDVLIYAALRAEWEAAQR
ncbi:MAG: GNAT family protein, partial [Chloroflexota bacterium]